MNCILGLDVSTKCIGVSLFNESGELLQLTHISPAVKDDSDNSVEILLRKADQVKQFFLDNGFASYNITQVIIEEPLVQSNNVNTVGVLLRFNGIITHICFERFKVYPKYISSYEARKNAFPELMQPGATKKPVLFGGFPKDTDKKKVLWEKVSALEPQVQWVVDKKGKLKAENYDRSDAYIVGKAYLNMNKPG